MLLFIMNDGVMHASSDRINRECIFGRQKVILAEAPFLPPLRLVFPKEVWELFELGLKCPLERPDRIAFLEMNYYRRA